MRTIRCQEDLGIQGCGFVARGETAGDVVDEVVAHVRHDHNLKLPPVDTILTGQASHNPLTPDLDKGASTVVRRLQEALELGSEEGPALPHT